MRQGNGYVVIFAVLMTVICGGLLAGVAVGLKDTHNEQELLNTKKKILGAAFGSDATKWTSKEIAQKYDANVKGYVVNMKGEMVEGVDVLKVDPRKEYKKKNDADKLFPVFEVKDEVFPTKVGSYVLPVYGGGLWDNIWGFMAVAADKNTIAGAVFEHKAETPGLGARISDDPQFQSRFVGKKIKNEAGVVVSVEVQKGEGKDYSSNPHQVDGLSGASMTTGGLNLMLSSYFKYYEAFLNK